MSRPTIFAILSFVTLYLWGGLAHAATPLIDGATILRGTVIEGGMIFARTVPGSRVMLDNTSIDPSPGGFFAIGFHRDSDAPLALIIQHPSGAPRTTILHPAQRNYKIQRIDGLASNMVTPPQAVIDRIRADSAAVRAARSTTPQSLEAVPEPDWLNGFDWPATGRISGIYGSQRILNGKPRQPHYGIDIAAPTGTPVRAPADGVITLVKDLYYSGWTIMMAHGAGINSGFLHLDQAQVSEGDRVRRGTIIGTVGSTGRSTGPHLDWRIDWHGRRVDASLLAPPMP